MNVAAILKQKGRAVTTARPTMTLMEVTNKLAANRIGAIVIVGTRGEVAGINLGARHHPRLIGGRV
jgi:CBS domain-containing protein